MAVANPADPTQKLGEPDPNSNIPPAARKQAERANEIIASIRKAQEEGTSQSNPETQQAQPAAQEPPKTEAAPEQAPATPPQIEEPTAKQPDWENRFRAMKGRFDRAQQENAQLNQRVADLEAMVESLKDTGGMKKGSYISDTDIEEYGPELVDFVERGARQAFGNEVEELKKTIQDLRQQLTGVHQRTASFVEQTFADKLTEAVPNWEEVNTSQDFLDWLDLTDPLSGRTRMDMLREAHSQADLPRTVAFFKQFLQEEAAITHREPSARPGNAGKVPLESLAAPGRAKAGSATATAPSEKPIITRDQIAKFYEDRRRGAYRGREQEADRMDREIFLATREGRVM